MLVIDLHDRGPSTFLGLQGHYPIIIEIEMETGVMVTKCFFLVMVRVGKVPGECIYRVSYWGDHNRKLWVKWPSRRSTASLRLVVNLTVS